jgi:hypothetical protein
MHRRRDHLGRFLPHIIQDEPFEVFNPKPKEPHVRNIEQEEPFENVLIDAYEQLPSPPSFEESFHLNELFADPEYQDNPLALIIYQPQQPGPPPRMAQPTFFSLLPLSKVTKI